MCFQIRTVFVLFVLVSTVHTQSNASVHKPGEDSSTVAATVVEQMPRMIGGIASLRDAVQYPERAKDAQVEGTVYVKFIVGTDGTVDNAEIVRGRGFGLDEEVLRAVSELKFRPGRQGNRRVPVVMYLPITFKLP